jgi:hypothetical protein
MNTKIMMNPTDLIYWFNAIRNLPNDQKNRALDAFWYGQIKSKVWLVDICNNYIDKPTNIVIFGGWIGVLASIMFQSSTYPIEHITSIDIDPWCRDISNIICEPHKQQFTSITEDMATFSYQQQPNLVINTSTEHITQQTYDVWYKNIPNKTIVLIQGNNFFNCDEHIRCSKSLNDFKLMNHVPNRVVFEGNIDCEIYDRYMCIWVKH